MMAIPDDYVQEEMLSKISKTKTNYSGSNSSIDNTVEFQLDFWQPRSQNQKDIKMKTLCAICSSKVSKTRDWYACEDIGCKFYFCGIWCMKEFANLCRKGWTK